MHETYEHNAFDWRKGTPLMSYPVESWFIKTTAVKDRMVELNKTINWKPSRNRKVWYLVREYRGLGHNKTTVLGYTSTYLAKDKNPDVFECIGSVSELKMKAGIHRYRNRPTSPSH